MSRTINPTMVAMRKSPALTPSMTPVNGSEHTQIGRVNKIISPINLQYGRAVFNTCICHKGLGQVRISVEWREKVLVILIKEFRKRSNTESENHETNS